MRHATLALLTVLPLTLGANARDRKIDPHEEIPRKNALSDEAVKILDNAGEIVLLSLNPSPKEAPVLFHGFPVLGKTVIARKEDRRKLLDSLKKGIADNDGVVAACFQPRHGIRASHDGKMVELVICFECMHVHVHLGDKLSYLRTTRSPAALFNKFLKEAKVPLPWQPGD